MGEDSTSLGANSSNESTSSDTADSLLSQLSHWAKSRQANGSAVRDTQVLDRELIMLNTVVQKTRTLFPFAAGLETAIDREVLWAFMMLTVHKRDQATRTDSTPAATAVLYDATETSMANVSGYGSSADERPGDGTYFGQIDSQLHCILSALVTLRHDLRWAKSLHKMSGKKEMTPTFFSEFPLSSHGNFTSPLLYDGFVFFLTSTIQNRAIDSAADNVTRAWFLYVWTDLLLLRPQQQLQQLDPSLVQEIMSLRERLLLSEVTEQPNITNATNLCAMAVDGMLRGNRQNVQAAQLTLDLLSKMITAVPHKGQSIRINRQILGSLVYRCHAVPPRDKWKLMQIAMKRDSVQPHPQKFFEMLTQCHELQDWATANSIVEHVLLHPSLLDNATLTMKIVNVQQHSVSPSYALKFWEDLPDKQASKWHGLVLCHVLLVAMSNKQHHFWTSLARTIVQSADEMHGGSWPTPFFDTRAMQRRFEKLSIFMVRALQKRSGANGPELARRWEAFAQDQVARFGTLSKDSKRRPASRNDKHEL